MHNLIVRNFWGAILVEVLMSIKFIISILQTVHDSQNFNPESWSMYFTYVKTASEKCRIKHRKSKSLGPILGTCIVFDKNSSNEQ